LPPNVDGSGYDMGTVDLPDGNPDAGTGTGTITMTFQGAGTHLAVIWLDLHIDNGTPIYWNEFGDAIGDPVPGQTWQVDEPGYGSLGYTGTIYNNVKNSALGTGSLLSNANSLPEGGANSPNDVSLALAQTFTLAAGQRALWTITLASVTDPGELAPGFYL